MCDTLFMAKSFNLDFHKAASIHSDYSDSTLSAHVNVWRFILQSSESFLCKQRAFFREFISMMPSYSMGGQFAKDDGKCSFNLPNLSYFSILIRPISHSNKVHVKVFGFNSLDMLYLSSLTEPEIYKYQMSASHHVTSFVH